MDELRSMILAVVRGLVEDRSAIRLRDRRLGPSGPLEIEIHVAPADRGRIIGRRGQTIAALRDVTDEVARRHRVRCRIEVAS